MVNMGNLDISLGGTLFYFYNVIGGSLLGKITDSMIIIIRVVRLMAGCF